MNKTTVVIISLVLFVISAGASYSLFSMKNSPVTGTPASPEPSGTATGGKKSKIDPSIPRTEECPLNGLMYTKGEKDTWATRRPLAVMIENHADSRPTSGLSSADIVYEAVAEGGITRYMGVYYCGAAAESVTLAPVRSARIYYTKLVLEYDALYNHVGGAGNCDDPTVNERAKALCFIRRNNIKDLDQFGRAGDFKTCHRMTNRLDHDVAYEHTMACFTDQLYAVGAKNNWSNVDAKGVAWDKGFKIWKFKDEPQAHGTVSSVSFPFWASQPSYSVSWKYDSARNEYLRENGGEKNIDLNTGAQIAAKNVVIQYVEEFGPLDDHKHMDYGVVGKGEMLLFQDGQVTTGTWSKTSPVSRTKFMDKAGKEISFTRGQIWIELVPDTSKVEYN